LSPSFTNDYCLRAEQFVIKMCSTHWLVPTLLVSSVINLAQLRDVQVCQCLKNYFSEKFLVACTNPGTQMPISSLTAFSPQLEILEMSLDFIRSASSLTNNNWKFLLPGLTQGSVVTWVGRNLDAPFSPRQHFQHHICIITAVCFILKETLVGIYQILHQSCLEIKLNNRLSLEFAVRHTVTLIKNIFTVKACVLF